MGVELQFFHEMCTFLSLKVSKKKKKIPSSQIDRSGNFETYCVYIYIDIYLS